MQMLIPYGELRLPARGLKDQEAFLLMVRRVSG